jgi:cyclopropane fatty-acyl-phospholipid synthase-like methyltransferase
MTFTGSLAATLLAVSLLRAQAPQSHPTSTPYTGDLSIFEEAGRDEKLQIDRVMDILRITSGKTVADIGAGGGWFTVRAAKRVGVRGRVYGEDISPAAVKAIEERSIKEHLPQVQAVLGTPDDPKLPAGTVNAVLMLKVYHEIADPHGFLEHLKPALASGARIGIIDRNGNGSDHGLKQAIVEREMKAAGFREIDNFDFTKADGQDYFLVFQLK